MDLLVAMHTLQKDRPEAAQQGTRVHHHAVPKPGTRTKYGRNVLPAADIEGEGSERDMTAADLSIHTIHLPRLDGCGICAEKVVVV